METFGVANVSTSLVFLVIRIYVHSSSVRFEYLLRVDALVLNVRISIQLDCRHAAGCCSRLDFGMFASLHSVYAVISWM